MSLLSTDNLIVLGFLLITLVIGLRAGRNIKDIREYAIANKVYGTGVLTMTFLATHLDGHNIVSAQKSVFYDGIIVMIPATCTVIMLLYTGRFIVPKMARFTDSLSVGDVMASLYGKWGGLITGIMGTLFSVFTVGAHAVVLGNICALTLHVPAYWGIAVGGMVLVVYSALGGVKSVTLTDVFQFLVFIVLIPIIAHIAVREVGGVRALFSQMPREKLSLAGHSKLYYYICTSLSWALFPAIFSSPVVIQRVLMAKNSRQGKSMFYLSAAGSFAVRTLLVLTCFSVAVLSPSILPTDGAGLLYITSHYFPPILQILGVLGILSIIMSTIDSLLHVGGVLFTRNVYNFFDKKSQPQANQVRLAKYSTFLLGCLGLCMALWQRQVYVLAYLGISTFVPVVTIPLIAGVLGLKPSSKAFVGASLITLLTFTLAKLTLDPKVAAYLLLPISLLANAVSFFAIHHRQYGGFAITRYLEPEIAINQHNTLQMREVLQRLTNAFKFPVQIVQWTSTRVERYGSNEETFSFFIFLGYMIPYFMQPHTDLNAYNWLAGIKSIGVMLCVGLLFKYYWPKRISVYFSAYYYFTLLYCLPFVTTFLFLLEGSSIEWIVNVALAIMLLVVLVDWLSFVVLSLCGIGLALLVYRMGIGPFSLHMDANVVYTLTYAVVFSTLIGLLFARRKQLRTDRREQRFAAQDLAHQNNLVRVANERLQALRAFQNLGVERLLTIARDLQHLPVPAESADRLHDIQKRLLPLSCQLQGLDSRATDYLRLHVEQFAVSAWLEKVRQGLTVRAFTRPLQLHNHTRHTHLSGDLEQLTQLVVEQILSLDTGAESQENEPIQMHLHDTELHYSLPDVGPDYVKHIEALCVFITSGEEAFQVSAHYRPDLTTSSAANGAVVSPKQIADAAAQRIVKAHYGWYEESQAGRLCTLPVDVRQLRLRDTDKKYMALDAQLVRANDHYKSDAVDAQAQETAFLSEIQDRPQADVALLKSALELIKCYHGPVARHTSEPFYLHPLAVAQIVLEYDRTTSTLLGALLHDTVEDTWMGLSHIEAVFGKETAELVDLVTHLQKVPNSLYKIRLSASENLQMLERSGSRAGLLIKLADRLHNLRTIEGHRDPVKQRAIAKETADFFIPLAQRMGMLDVAQEMHVLCNRLIS